MCEQSYAHVSHESHSFLYMLQRAVIIIYISRPDCFSCFVCDSVKRKSTSTVYCICGIIGKLDIWRFTVKCNW